MALIALVALTLLLAVNAQLVTNYPVNSQLPPVARVSKPYKFIFSLGTFGGVNSSTLSYSLLNAPGWLQVDSAAHALAGTPQEKDEGTTKFGLVASGEGESATTEVTLIVTKDDGPQLGTPLLPQLEAMGATSAPSTILIHSGDSFSLSFDSSTFTNTPPSTVYYGLSPNNAPLPSWIVFDQASLRFSGTAPNIGPQTFSFNLVASDVAGFSAATMSFDMVISPHILSFNDSAQTFFVNVGNEFTSPNFLDALTLDGRQPADADITKIEADSPDWLDLDKDSISLAGTPPENTPDTNVTISVTDKYSNVAKLIIGLKTSRFFRNLAECDAIIGEFFTFVFNDSVLTNESVQLEVDLGQKLPWLHYNADNKTLYGNVPSDLSPAKESISLTAREGTAEDNRQFTINTVEAGSTGYNGSNDSTNSGSGGISGNKAGIIAISVIIPVAFLISLVLLFCCWRRKRRATNPEDGHEPKEKVTSSGHEDTSGLPHCQPYENTIQGVPPQRDQTPPPKLELGLWEDEKEQPRDEADGADRTRGDTTLSNSTIEWGFAPLRDPETDGRQQSEEASGPSKRLSFQSSPPVRKRTNSSRRREPLRPIQPKRSLKRDSMHSSRSKRHSKRSSGIASVASGLPVRLSGAGHGAGLFGPPGHGVVRVSWQNTHMSFQSDDNSVGNLAPLFPRPPRARDSLEYPKRMSLRAVEPDTMTISETDSLEAFVHSRAKYRNSSNPLFSGQMSRRPSSGMRALERARSNASRADTIGSSIYNDDYRRSVQDRPWSTALSASIYTDDNRQSAYLDSLSEKSINIRPLAPVMKKASQSSLAQNYTDAIAPIPRFLSEISLDKARRRGSGNSDCKSGEPEHILDERLAQAQNRGRSKTNPDKKKYRTSTSPYTLRESPSSSSMQFDGKPHRVSLIRMEANQRGFQREPTGSVGSGMAFV
ncbi:hypothetical protein FE257_010190 [Aspergillus nanangensis]|uniref:Dystroglycan-type cadherin-like domain-containing protein n=1 Tax=Aspergillus nanangensis TaxID=2582783 RepID=A0AAD4GTI7_ASPNN|nr:hypothetical protein FE257_010190 [Aspergillus nanangensis]